MRSASLSLVLSASLSSALVNVTVDDSAAGSSIHFTSQNCVTVEPDGAGTSWEVSPGRFVHSCHRKTLRRCDDPGATATFKFTGVAVYLLYPPWPHEMTITATLDSNPPILLTIPAGSEGVPVDLEADASSAPVWGLSGLPNVEHTLTIGRQDPGAGIYVDAFMYTALCDAEPYDRRRRKGGDDPEGVEDSESDPPPVSASSSSAGKSSVSSALTSNTSKSTSSPTSTPLPTSTPTFAGLTSPPSSTPTLPPTTAISQSAFPRRDAVGIALGTVLGVLVLAIILFFAWRRYRRRMPTPDSSQEKSPPYTASDSSSEQTRPPSMRERRDRFSDTHTPAGTPLTGTPASCLTSLSSNSMRLAHLSNFPGPSEKKNGPPSSLNGTSMQDDESDDVPPPQYETPR